MQGRLIEIDSLGERELEAWRELARRAVEPNPFFEPEFAVPAFRHLAGAGVALLVVETRGEWLACMPIVSGRWRGPVRAVRSWRHMYAFLGTPLVSDEDARRSLGELLRAAAAEPSGRLVALEWTSVDGSLTSALTEAVEESGLMRVGDVPFERATLRRRDQGLLELQPRKRKQELKRQRRRLEELLDGSLQCLNRAGDPEAVRRFLELEAASWKGRKGTAMAADAAHATFFEEVCSGFAAAERLDLFELRGGERTVAMKCNLHAAPGLFTFKITYDEELAKFSPGIQLELENVDKFNETDLEWMDSCASPDNQMVNRLWPDRRTLSTVVLARSGIRARASALGLKAVKALRARRRTASAAI